MDGNRVLETLEERLTGRFVVEPVVDPKTGEVLMEADRMMTADDAKRIADAGIESVKIRSLITCKSRHGVCRKCYGANLAFNEPVQVGEAVGIIAAQSIGEPGTQLTMRTFHTGGVAGGADITQGLPRVEELFEARKPKQLAILSEIEGDVRFEEIKKSRHVIVYNNETAEEKKYLIPYGARLCENIVEGAHIKKGTELTLGAVNPHDVLAILGEEAVYNYLIKEVQFAYRTQGVDINDKQSKLLFVKCLRNALLMNQAILILLQVQWLMFQQLMKQMIKLKQELKPVKKILRRQLIFLFLWVSQKLLLQQIHSFRLHHSRKQQEFLPMLLSKVRVIRLSVLRKMLLSVNLFRQVPVWMYSARLMLFQVIFQQKTAMKF